MIGDLTGSFTGDICVIILMVCFGLGFLFKWID